MRKVVLSLVMLYACALNAQWRVGLTAGADYNMVSCNMGYMERSWSMNGGPCATAGVMGQYDIWDFDLKHGLDIRLGARMDFNWIMKANQFQYNSDVFIPFKDNYLQMPVMATFSFCNKKWRGLLDFGFYGSCHLNSMDKRYDRLWGYGLVGGMGVDWQWARHWGTQLEAFVYYSLLSETKGKMPVSSPRYNTTVALQACIYYAF